MFLVLLETQVCRFVYSDFRFLALLYEIAIFKLLDSFFQNIQYMKGIAFVTHIYHINVLRETEGIAP